ncbi:phosphoglycerate dehydrogenase [Desulforhabdus amnigena]|jgi:D-3-phosphoglycerate dehydrogenase|uniref:D-3-phosphoglycerate dehydrogenase n=1 Tax=Desulforhabdus amnigena TaxID=40218 RepID=A0A9W6D5S6_9BACT|nr:phosphoglycerate dehydrogenase [Desulforhabdus amnigena]NLJ26798.1 phosphoglycerate dehydrogenase [Deltaproteobacteria bacterium]GLI34782.1 D-3-phosphoglycerate dehydrogenase [Desulforhabdus amnigena]
MKVLVSDNLADSGIEKLMSVPEFEVEVNTSLTKEEFQQIIKEYDALVIRSATKVTADVIEAADNLKVIARAGIGLDNVDIEAASKRGIVVMNTPEGNVITTAEHTIAMMLSLSRNIPQATQSLKVGKWEKKRFRGKEVFNKVLGIIGVGRIGRVVADRAKGLKMHVIAYDPYISTEVIDKMGIEGVALDELFARSDYITVHTPMTQETRNILNAEAFAKMKKGVFILNCARGGIVNEDDLLKAIESGIVAGAAMDVFVVEPPKDHPLLALDQVIATPHLGASTDEAQENVATAVADQVIDYLLRGTIRNAVNAPNIDGAVLARLRPYLTLAEKLGSLLAQITRGAIQEIAIEYVGEVTKEDTQPLTISILKGLLTPILGDMVNFVNVPVMVKERNIKVTESMRTEAEDFTTLINVSIKTSEERNLVAGTIFGKKDPRIVRINDFRMESAMEGNLLLIYNIDTPGTIGAIGTCLGRNKINISMMDVGQVLERGQNIIFLQTDSVVPKEVVQELLAMENVNVVQTVKL